MNEPYPAHEAGYGFFVITGNRKRPIPKNGCFAIQHPTLLSFRRWRKMNSVFNYIHINYLYIRMDNKKVYLMIKL
jgi:hypothetical protein